MKKLTLAAVCCIGLGVILFAAGQILYSNDIESYKEHMNISDINKTVVSDDEDVQIAEINIDTDYSDIIVVSDESLADGEVKIECSDIETDKFTDEINDGVLTVRYKEEDHLFNFELGFMQYTPSIKISVNLPLLSKLNITDSCGNVTIESINCDTLSVGMDYGDMYISKISAEAVSLLNSCGNVNLENFECKTLTTDLDYGDIKVQNLTAESFDTENSCGNIEIIDSQSANGLIHADYGDIILTDCELSDYDLSDNCGDITADNCRLSGISAVSSDYGDIKLKLSGSSSDYTIIYKSLENSVSADGNVIYINVDSFYIDDVQIEYVG